MRTLRLGPVPLALLVATVLTPVAAPASTSAQSAPTPPEELPPSGAAYRTGKSMFFGIRKVEVVGVTPGIELALEADGSSGGLRIVAEIAATTFDSGNDSRDEWVAETLGGMEGAPLRFYSDTLSAPAIRGALEGRPTRVPGRLELPEGPRDVVFEVAVYELAAREGEGTEKFLEAWTRTTFDALGIEVPKVGPGGAIASPGDDVELWLRVPVVELGGRLPSDSLPGSPH